MPCPPCLFPRARQRGDARVALAITLLLLACGGALTWVWWQRTHADDLASEPAAAGSIVRTEAPPTAPRSIEQLLNEARAAVAAQQLVAPAGQSAFERYLAVLAQQPANPIATDALRELFPFAAEQVGATIRDGQLDEAQRQLDLLARADPANYTLTLLRAQLTEQRQRVLAAAATAPAPALAPTRSPASREMAAATAPSPPGTPAEVPPVTQTAMVTPPAPITVPAATFASVPNVPSTAPVLQRRVEPYYPQAARRSRREGWVEVEFTVQPDGHVDAVKVLQSKPGSVFDLAATTAVQRWVFAPATRNGKPVAVSLRQRLDFRL
ncbi:energy transducer TonB [Dyella sp.]|uniref:energy transducer TonB n=1 Tax=Dyella sp. TaxID=1869338 RepID=UPI003F7D3554